MYCPNCGRQNKDDAAFCMNCGNALNKASSGAAPVLSEEPAVSQPQPVYQAPAYQAPTPKKKRTGLIIGLSVGGAVLVVAIIVLLALPGNSSVEGIWQNKKYSEVLEFDDDGDVTIYTPRYEIDGEYVYNTSSGKGAIGTDAKAVSYTHLTLPTN